MIHAATIADVQQAVRTSDRVRVVAGGTKPALAANANLSLARLAGVLEYEPSEYTFTALAGTKITEISRMLAENGQFLPFDPLLAAAGATLGGTVAAATSGPGRLRFGGVRDFLLGARFVNGEGDIVFGGGKVVKNAAGFDMPKLMVGALGELGVLVELTFKVFPRPESSASLAIEVRDIGRAIELMNRLAASPLEMFSLELEPPTRLWLRIAGIADALAARVERIKEFLGADCEANDVGEQCWRRFAELEWVPAAHVLAKVPLAPTDIVSLEAELAKIDLKCSRRYSVAGNVAYVTWPESLDVALFDELFNRFGRGGVILRGACDAPRLGRSTRNAFGERLRSVLDPRLKFVLPEARGN